MQDAVIRTNGLTKIYRNKRAVDDISICVNEGDIYGLIGKNGAGKTTLMRLLTGLGMPDGGSMEMFGEHTKRGLERARRRTGCIIESPSFFPYLSARDNMEYYRIQRGIPDEGCVDYNLSYVGLDPNDKKRAKNFSMGMKQRLGLALAIMPGPDLLILDEPINGLDPTGIVEVRELLLKLNKERHTTIVISSHILGELSQMATKYGFINGGKLVEEVSAESLSEKVRHCVSVKVDDGPAAAVIIERELGCTDYEVLSDNNIRVYKHIDRPDLITAALVNGGIAVYEVCRAGANLEDYFISLVGGEHDA